VAVNEPERRALLYFFVIFYRPGLGANLTNRAPTVYCSVIFSAVSDDAIAVIVRAGGRSSNRGPVSKNQTRWPGGSARDAAAKRKATLSLSSSAQADDPVTAGLRAKTKRGDYWIIRFCG
jgi:hypothetical protein